MKRFFILILLLCCISNSQAQNKKVLNIKKTNISPKIDAILDDEAWIDADEATDFVQFRPDIGVKEKEHQKTIVKMTYDDNAVYFAAYLHDNPDDILKQVATRDNFAQADFFGVVLNPNNDGQNDTEFFVFSSGNQADAVVSPGSNEDFGWNAVWDSAVKIVEDGWIVEMKIPYSALRFSNKEVQTWGLQLHRRFRTDESQYTWNPIDPTKGYFGSYSGIVEGIKNITPPTRLSFYPYASFLTRSFDGEKDNDFSYGMDVKYGITENFTLDATLVPDFSQAGFDNVELNLGPFEQRFSEQRQFFKEGVDLFNKGDLFYSRRIGSRPTGYPNLDADEEVTDMPNKVKMLNAVKISGRTKKGLGVGFFNAITEKTEATITKTEEILNPDTNVLETIISKRKEVVEPISNYNILVIDKQFGQNSSVSFVNTSVLRSGDFRDANVSAALFDITNKRNTYNYEGEFKVSHLNLIDDDQTGFSGSLGFNKVSGNYRFGIDYDIADTKFNINDLGIQRENNYSNFSSYFSYQTFEPKGRLNSFRINAWFNYRRLFKPSTYTGKNVGFFIRAQTKKLWTYSGNMNWNIGTQYDYWEPRTTGRYFRFKNNFNANGRFNTNFAKPFAIAANAGFATLFDPDRDVFFKWFRIGPRFRFSDKFTIGYNYRYNSGNGGRGYVTTIGDTGEIIFGQRSQRTIENSISGTYNFNPYHGLNLTFRNYWSTVTYNHKLYTLHEDGSTTNDTGHTVDNIGSSIGNPDYNPDVNFNTWNLDFSYTWQFAPGSQLTALYRNSLFNFSNLSRDSFFDSLDSLFEQPIEHIFSLRMVYYIDYNNIKSLFKKQQTI